MQNTPITNSDTLLAWLQTRPQTDSIAIAHRCALRVWPESYAQLDLFKDSEFELLLVQFMRVMLLSAISPETPPPNFRNIAGEAASQVIQAAKETPVADTAYYIGHSIAIYGIQSAATYATIIAAAYISRQSVASTAAMKSTDVKRATVMYWPRHPLMANYRPGAPPQWQAIRADATALQAGTDPFTLPLWHGETPPEWFSANTTAMRTYWQTTNPNHWAFWLRWYDAAIAGRPLDWQLQHDIALIPDDVWQSGPGPVAEAIAKIEAEHLAARTNNGERLEINPATGLIRLVPETGLPADIASYANRKMAKALAIVNSTTENQYRPLEPVLQIVRAALDDAANLPVELFDTCASATRLVASMVRNDVIPSPDQDARIDEFVTLLREAGADILAHDPKTQEVLTRRNSILGNNALVANAEAIQFVVQQLVTMSEGTIVRALPRDAAIVLDPKADLADANESRYRFFGRLVRYASFGAKGLAKGVILTGEVIASGTSIYMALNWLLATPQFQLTWTAILRWMGFT